MCMDRRKFIKNSMMVVGCSCAASYAKINFDNQETTYDGVKLTHEEMEQKFLSKDELPNKLRVDACSLCQLNCPCCFVRLNSDKVEQNGGLGYLKFLNFKKLVDENNIKEIELSNLGEIFLNPELLDIIKYAYEKNIILTATTGVNLNYLTDEMAEALVKYQFNRVTVSIDGASKETYAIYRRGGDFNTVINNIKKINFYKMQYQSTFPLLDYKFILFGHNEHEIDKAIEIANSLEMNIIFAPNFSDGYSPVKDLQVIKNKTGLDLTKNFLEILYEKYKENPNSNWWNCKCMWNAPQINWDGKVLGCCSLFWDNFGGNVFKDGLLKALNNPKFIYAKNILANNKEPLRSIPCSTCVVFSFLKKHNIEIKPKNKQATEMM